MPQLISDFSAYLDSDDPKDYSTTVDALIERANALLREINHFGIENDTR